MATEEADLIGRYQQLVRHSADVITLVDEAGVIEYQSPSIERVLGYDQDTLVGASVFEYIHPDDQADVQAALEDATETPEGTVHEAEYRFKHRDGSWVWLASVATDRTGAANGFVVNSRDVTDRHEALADLKAEHDLYESVVEGVNDAIAIVQGGTITYANPQCHALLNLEPGELEGETFDAVVAPEDHELVAERYLKRMDVDAPEPPSRYEVTFMTADGDRRIGEVNAESLVYRGEPAVLVAIRDVTERKRSEERVKARSEELEALNRVVRHDIRNDMAVVLGWAEMLEDHVDDEGEDYLEKVLKSAEHVVELTEVARDFVDTLTSGTGAELKPIPFGPSLETELAIREESHPDASFMVEEELPDVPVTANEMLASVFTNLLNNAVQHNPDPEPEVWLSAEVDGDEVELRVADNGPGVPDDRKDRIFGKGEKGLDSEGTGIGLYLVQTLVEQYGGSVHVEDHDPEGAVFVVRLPVAE